MISAAGQSLATRRLPDRRAFHEVDYRGNARLLEAAEATGSAGSFMSRCSAPHAWAAWSTSTHTSGSSTGFAPARSRAPWSAPTASSRQIASYSTSWPRTIASRFGGGSSQSNPIHEAELALACLEALEAGAAEVDAGGPETLSRRQEVELAFAAVGREPPHPVGPPRSRQGGRLGPSTLRPLDRRRVASLAFLAAINSIDMVAPRHGSRRLADYLTEHAGPVHRH